jgi:hypothetical protein
MNNLPNGGFPPIKYCIDNKNEKNEKTEVSRERHFAASVNQIFSSKNIKPIIIDTNTNKDNDYELNEITDISDV